MTEISRSGAPSASVPADRSIGETPCAPILDYDSLVDRCMGNIEFAARVLAKFEKGLSKELEELDSALARKDSDHLARVAHRIKGTSANVSALTLQCAAEAIESLGRSSQLAEAAPRVEQLRQEWKRYQTYTASLLPATNPG